MNKVFIVTSGEYSDYGIDRVFSTEEKAKEWVNVITSMYASKNKYSLYVGMGASNSYDSMLNVPPYKSLVIFINSLAFSSDENTLSIP